MVLTPLPIVCTLLCHIFLIFPAYYFLYSICKNRPCNPLLAGQFRRKMNDYIALTTNERRYANASKFLENRRKSATSKSFGEIEKPNYAKVDISMPIIATRRTEGNYLSQIVAEVLQQLDGSPLSVSPFICNVDSHPKQFVEAVNLGAVISIYNIYSHRPVVKYNKTSYKQDGRVMSADEMKIFSVISKEKTDYALCLWASHTLWPNSNFTLLLEDDALPKPDFFLYLSDVIDQLSHSKSIDVAYVKLYHPEWLRKIPWLLHAAGWAVILTAISSFAFRKSLSEVSSRRSSALILFAVLQFCFYFGIFFSLGHQVLADWRLQITKRVYLTIPESCCTPAVIFPNSCASKVVNFLQSAETGPKWAKDHILDELPKSLRLRALASDINMITHIGMRSSLRNAIVKVDDF